MMILPEKSKMDGAETVKYREGYEYAFTCVACRASRHKDSEVEYLRLASLMGDGDFSRGVRQYVKDYITRIGKEKVK